MKYTRKAFVITNGKEFVAWEKMDDGFEIRFGPIDGATFFSSQATASAVLRDARLHPNYFICPVTIHYMLQVDHAQPAEEDNPAA